MNVKKLVIIMLISIVCVVGIVALIVNLNKEPVKIIATDITETLGYNMAKEYYGFSDKNKEKYFSIENIDDAYNSLIEGENVVILTTLPSEEILMRLKSKNIEIETYPVARDALVFINSKLNSVDNLKSEDIKKIYSKIFTNWEQVGGDNLDIIAYQSKSNGNLYNALKNFMGDYVLENPKIRLKDETFSGLVNALTKYLDTRKKAIGYTNFSTINSESLSDEVRILSLDNIEPNINNIYMGEYSGTFEICLITRKDNSQAKRLVEYMKSKKGQAVIRESGYVTVEK